MGINNRRKTVSDLVSVVIPVYGSFDPRRTILTVESARKQRDVNVEVIVSEQGEGSKLIGNLPADVRHVFNRHIPSSSLSDFNPGLIRNLAVDESCGEFIYTNDSDVLFFDENYLARGVELLKANFKLVLHRPPMRRLPLDNFEDFWQSFNTEGMKIMDHLDLSQQYLATTDRKERKLKVVKKNREYYPKTFTAFKEDFERYLADPSLKGKEPTIWTEDLHCGGNLFRRSQFEEVGRYSQRFINWGCEDSDLQWKFMEMFSLEFFPYRKEFEVLHLDHPKGYFSAEMWKKNEEIESQRRVKGIEYAIREDKRDD
jgi:hypothetical protein